MHPTALLEAQLALGDSFLAELEQLRGTTSVINFNNTKQFDALLSYLEALVLGTFTLVPSVNVLHILFTLAARCPNANWTHSPSSMVPETSDYMKLVNRDYDAVLAKSLLQARSHALLERYLILLQSDVHSQSDISGGMPQKGLMRSHPSRIEREALRLLHIRFEKAIAALVPMKKDFFTRRRLPSPLLSTPEQMAVVEVISDSEGLDSLIDEEPIRLFSVPVAVTSLSDLGRKTSGLGETTALFESMPHLLAHATPEPEIHGAKGVNPNFEEATDTEAKANRKSKMKDRSHAPEKKTDGPKRRVYGTQKEKRSKNLKKLKSDSLSAVSCLRVFDDVVLAKAIDPNDGYDFWALLRWAFTCADASSQYQKFLFNSANTHVHCIYRSYESVFDIVFRFLSLQFQCQNFSLLDRALRLIGPPRTVYERAVEYILTGLGQATSSTPYPCYVRERLLLKHDPLVQNSQCKTFLEYTDNQHSMRLRFRIAVTLYLYEKRAGSIELLIALAEKLLTLDFCHLKSFFDTYPLLETLGITCSVATPFLNHLGSILLDKLTGLQLNLYDTTKDDYARLQQILLAITSEKVYSNISNDYSLPSFDHFWKKWQSTIFLFQWLLLQTLSYEQVEYPISIVNSLEKADGHIKHFYHEFLDSHWDDADVQAEDLNFTLSLSEITQYKQREMISYMDVFKHRFPNAVSTFTV